MPLKPALVEERHRWRLRSKQEIAAAAAAAAAEPPFPRMDLTAPSQQPIGFAAIAVDLRHTRLVMAAAEVAGSAAAGVAVDDIALAMSCWRWNRKDSVRKPYSNQLSSTARVQFRAVARARVTFENFG